jgi:hypothetical protein
VAGAKFFHSRKPYEPIQFTAEFLDPRHMDACLTSIHAEHFLDTPKRLTGCVEDWRSSWN